jgi:hypothetical protein
MNNSGTVRRRILTMPTILEEVSIVISTYFTLHFGVLDFHALNFQTSLPLLEDRDLSGKDSDASPLIPSFQNWGMHL